MTRQAGAITQLSLCVCVLRECEGVDPIVCVNKPSHSAPVWLNSANERCLWLGLASTALIAAKYFNTHTHTHTHTHTQIHKYTNTHTHTPTLPTLNQRTGVGGGHSKEDREVKECVCVYVCVDDRVKNQEKRKE